MTATAHMLQTYPGDLERVDQDALVECIDACLAGFQACTACADSCLAQEEGLDQLRRCIRVDLDCADICRTTAAVLSRHTEEDVVVKVALLRACVSACQSCVAECERHAGLDDHWRVCADACRRCLQACQNLLDRPGLGGTARS